MRIFTKKMIHPGLYIMECPECGEILASASERELLPEFMICKECSKKDETQSPFKKTF